jgi:hypothetical protein
VICKEFAMCLGGVLRFLFVIGDQKMEVVLDGQGRGGRVGYSILDG